ncbi:MAG TPA: glycerate kinase [Anaerolineae bacterium]|nr:glycerate kinase [Anaerolineae bacterium]
MTTPASSPPFELRQIAGQMIRAALAAADPAAAVRNYFAQHPEVAAQISATPGRLIVVGAGKAGAPMAQAVSDIFDAKISRGQVIVKYGYTTQKSPIPNPQSPIQIVEAGHPIPDQAGLQAAQGIAALLRQASANDTVFCLISGGASALLTLPAEPLTLTDLQATTAALLAAGATINQVNTIRKHLSAIKGGRLAQLAQPATVYALILSDVVGDPLEVIGSGPTVPDPTTFADAWAIVEQFQLQTALPPAVIQRLQAGCAGDVPDTPKPNDSIFERVHNIIIGSNRLAARAADKAAQSAGFEAGLLSTFVEGEAREVGKVAAALAKGLARAEGPLPRPACLVMGGETTVTLQGNGRGGRNQEMALAAAIALAGWSDVLVACFGTDGSDGPTDAAGAFADGHSVGRAQVMGLEAVEYLQRNDAYNFFAPLDDLILTGPTNTNVNDLTFILAR